MNTGHIKPPGLERRRYFRIADDITLFYKIIDAKAIEAGSHVLQGALEGCSISTAWHILTQEAKIIQSKIELKDPEMGEYFKLLNAKLDLVAQAAIVKEADKQAQKTRNVSLSASGVAFDNETALQLGEYLEVKMILGSVVAVIAVHAKVVCCRQNTDPSKPPFLIGLDYVNIQEQDRELLIQYIVQKQKQQIRNSLDLGH